ncbi:MAG: hypothetical protein L0I76_01365 [Pseudonocardia sp.]|nr:hypothetical protein [Pseudonocardia sp.]
MRDDAERLAHELAAAGASCVLEVWDEQPHVFQAFAPLIPEAISSIDRIGAFLRRAFAGRS